MAFEDDMIEAGFHDEESYLECLLNEDDKRIERQSQLQQEERILESMSDDDYESYMEGLLEEREDKRMQQQRRLIEAERKRQKENIKNEIKNSKLNRLQMLKEQWLLGNSNDVVIWRELEKQEDKKNWFYDELLFLQTWYGWMLCRKEFRDWKNKNRNLYISLESAFEGLRSKGYSTKEEFNVFTFHYIFDKLRLEDYFDFLSCSREGKLCQFDYRKRLEQFNLWKAENAEEWNRIIQSPIRDYEDINEVCYISELTQDAIIDFLVLNDDRYTFEQVTALFDQKDFEYYYFKRNQLTDKEIVHLRKKYFPQYHDEIVLNFNKYLRTLNEMSDFALSERYNPDFLRWLVSHKEMDVTQDWLEQLKQDSAPIHKGILGLHNIEDYSYSNIDMVSCIFMGNSSIGLNYMHLDRVICETDDSELLKAWNEEGEFLKEYNDWLWYMDSDGRYEDFFERLNQDELLQK